MVLFSRNPRFRFVSKLYGFALIIGSGSWHWIKLSIEYLDKSYIRDKLTEGITTVKSGKHPIDKWSDINCLSYLSEVQDVNLQRILKEYNLKEGIKKELIAQEEFCRMELWKKLNNKIRP